MSETATPTIQIKKAAPKPFSAQELRRAEGLAERLRGELQAAVDRMSKAGVSIATLSRELGVDRATCHRIVSSLEAGLTPLQALTKVPGPEGLRLFAEAAKVRLGGSSRRTALLETIEHYHALIRELGGSQIKLIKRLQATDRLRDMGAAIYSENDELAIRRHIRGGAARFLGHDVAFLPFVSAMRPMPESPNLIEGLNTSGLIGMNVYRGPLTLLAMNTASRERDGNLLTSIKTTSLSKVVDDTTCLFDEFCSPFLPLTISEDADGTTRMVLDPPHDAPIRSLDVAFARQWASEEHPMAQQGRRWTQVLLNRRPCQRVLFDVYLHRSMADFCLPSIAAYQLRPGLTGDPAKHWYEQLPGRLTLERLGTGLGSSASDAWADHTLFTQKSFGLAGWDPNDFVGFRCDVQEPVWSAAYYMSFDFSHASQPE